MWGEQGAPLGPSGRRPPYRRPSARARAPVRHRPAVPQVDGNVTTPIKFAQTFHLMPTAAGSWYIHNDIFRLNYC